MHLKALDGRSLCTFEHHAFCFTAYLTGVQVVTTLDKRQAEVAAAELADIHQAFSSYPEPLSNRHPEWLHFSLRNKTAEIGRYLQLIKQRGSLDEFDTLAVPLLSHQQETLSQIPPCFLA